MKWYGWQVSSGKPADFSNKAVIAKQCLEIANAAKFPTDYDDVFSHLFGNENYTICMVYDDNNLIVGFSVFAKLEEINTLYLHGIVLHPKAQGKGLSFKMIQKIIDEANLSFLSARTRNPRMFETITKFACSSNYCYPNLDNKEIPAHIFKLVKNNPFTNDADELLICRNAYPDKKLTQSFRDKRISSIFKQLNAKDAQVIVVKTK